MPLAGLFLSATFLGAMFARSFKELTFVTVTITVSLTSYAFVPAIFTDIIPIALISPLTLVVRDLQGQSIALGEFLFSVVPPTLTALVMFLLGAGLYREEDMFTQRRIPLKVLDALAGPIRGRASAAKMSALLIPFVLVTELVAIALLFALGGLSIPLVLVVVAVVEEVGKSLHVYAGYAHAKFDRSLRTALVVGAFSGLGFFLAEKLSLIARLTGLPGLPIGEAALNTGLVSGPPLLGFLFLPLARHVVTASISAVGARKSRRAYVAAMCVAILVHVAYNLTVVSLLVN
jgi:ABC-type Na+ efflux pump permease subunit